MVLITEGSQEGADNEHGTVDTFVIAADSFRNLRKSRASHAQASIWFEVGVFWDANSNRRISAIHYLRDLRGEKEGLASPTGFEPVLPP